MKIGSLFSGAGGLDLAVEQALGARTVWHCELDPAASKVLAHRWPGVPNLGDITKVDWSIVDPVDILAGGFPCQDVSAAGRRAGISEGTRSGLWSYYAEAINQLRPRLVIIENVRGLLSARAHRAMESAETTLGDGNAESVLRALGAVLGDLADIGYDAQWTTLAASAVGAPHRRERVFIVAHPADTPRECGTHIEGCSDAARQPVIAEPGTGSRDSGRQDPARVRQLRGSSSELAPVDLQPGLCQHCAAALRRAEAGEPALRNDDYCPDPNICDTTVVDLLPTPVARDFKGTRPADMNRNSPCMSAIADLLPTPSASDGTGGGQHPDRRAGHSQQLCDYALLDGTSQWGKYAAAIARWEAVAGPAPSPTELNKNGNPRLAAAFPEWMMGWPAGWVTQVPGISRNDQLRIIGNGVVPQQAAAALRWLLSIEVAA
ncbi:DNA methylase [Mycobacterium phage Cornucopia]|nr:DNA methylase [Mycobacterium phage Cornucopia]WAA20379.1 DNA methyltransferase [Mycobacterium phage VRedHorse]